MIGPLAPVRVTALREGRVEARARTLPEEVPVALSYHGTAQAVMLATPADLADFGRGFTLTEGIVEDQAAIEELVVAEVAGGIDVQMRLAGDASNRLAARRRAMAGPVGCGLCGIDTIAGALRPMAPVVPPRWRLDAAEIPAAMEALRAAQALNAQAHALHAAGLWAPGAGLVAAREDVGRHNALDKLAGAVAGQGGRGAVVLTSRVSVEMVQKSAAIGAPVILAVSAPTALAVREADRLSITLAAVVRGAEFEIFTHPDRITLPEEAHVR